LADKCMKFAGKRLTVIIFYIFISNFEIKFVEAQPKHKVVIPMNRIKAVLCEKGIKQTWLAEQLGKSYNIVNAYVQNRYQPRLEVLFEIAKILHVKPKDLIEDTNGDDI
jgi:putative transcriptional regulator